MTKIGDLEVYLTENGATFVSEMGKAHASEMLRMESGVRSEDIYRQNVAKRIDAAERIDVALRDMAAAISEYAAAGTALSELRQIGTVAIPRAPDSSLTGGHLCLITAINFVSRQITVELLLGPGELHDARKPLGVLERQYWEAFAANLEAARKSAGGGSD